MIEHDFFSYYFIGNEARVNINLVIQNLVHKYHGNYSSLFSIVFLFQENADNSLFAKIFPTDTPRFTDRIAKSTKSFDVRLSVCPLYIPNHWNPTNFFIILFQIIPTLERSAWIYSLSALCTRTLWFLRLDLLNLSCRHEMNNWSGWVGRDIQLLKTKEDIDNSKVKWQKYGSRNV